MANISRAERARREAEKRKAATPEVNETLTASEVSEVAASDASGVISMTEAVQANIPPCPPMSIHLGDRTPEVVEWVKQYQPERFKDYYQTRWPKLYGTAE